MPVSATILTRLKEYDATLERFSIPLMVRLHYERDEFGTVEVQGDSSGLYRYPDLTHQAEALYGWIQATIEEEIPREARFVMAYRDARRQVDQIVELPDPLAAHLVARCMEQKGRLSKTRRDRDFKMLTDTEVASIEDAIRTAMSAHGMDVEESPDESGAVR